MRMIFEFFITAVLLLIVLSILAAVGGFLLSKGQTFKDRTESAFDAWAIAISFLPIGIVPITIVFNLLFR